MRVGKKTSGKIKHTNICIIGLPAEGEKGAENLLEEIIPENFLNLEKKTEIQFQKRQSPKQEPTEIHTVTYN